jgi:gliding motility-associated-like protein
VYGIVVTDPSNGCKGYVDAVIKEPSLQLSASANIARQVTCFGGNNGKACIVALGGGGGYRYKWNAIRDSICVSDLEVGTYVPTITDINGCTTVTAPVVITGPTAPIAIGLSLKNKACGTNPNGILCVNTVGNAKRPYTYLWNDGLAQTDSCATGLASGGYNVTVTDSKGCTASTALSVPSVNLTLSTRDTCIERGKNLIPNVICNVDSDLLNSILWSPKQTVSDSTDLFPTLSPKANTNYILTISKDGCTISDTLSVTICNQNGFKIAVPTGFAPGGNGPEANNYFYPILNENTLSLTAFKVFNKWGQIVYDSTEKPGWDGTWQGALQPPGAYVYLLEYKEKVSGASEQMSGDIIMIR